MRTAQLGREGEEIAARFLSALGWAVLHRNFRSGHKEIDIIVRRGDLVAFVEVKTRTGARFGHPLEAITHRKRHEIQEAAAAWISLHGAPDDRYRFDAIAVFLSRAGGRPRVEHVENAWQL